MRLALSDAGPAISPISPRRELGAYEALWLEKGATFRSLAAKFAAIPTRSRPTSSRRILPTCAPQM